MNRPGAAPYLPPVAPASSAYPPVTDVVTSHDRETYPKVSRIYDDLCPQCVVKPPQALTYPWCGHECEAAADGAGGAS